MSKFTDSIMSAVMPLLPKDDLSYWVGRLVHQELPEGLRLSSMRAFAKAYNIDLSEAEKPLEQYKSIGDLFTRRLKEDARPIGSGLVHPCDSKIAEAGTVHNGKISQVKGISYPVPALLQSDEMASRFTNGTFLTYYLCPTDYHRVHAPMDLTVEWIQHIPGAFWPVNSWSVRNVDQLYSLNERVAMVFRTNEGESLALVMVAATNVGSISIAFDERINSAVRPKGRRKAEYAFGGDTFHSSREPVSPLKHAPVHLKKGDEVGVFSMGSSVVMLLDKTLAARLGPAGGALDDLRDKAVKLGQTIRRA
jgi:phosphatidylserine decarboxylase